ncbi:MAG: hypothetical protein ACREU2_03590 [Steroidobacteraceae bacterium]
MRYRAATLIEEPGARPVIQSREHWWLRRTEEEQGLSRMVAIAVTDFARDEDRQRARSSQSTPSNS